MTGRPRFLGRYDPAVGVEHGGREADVADRGGDAGQPAQPVDQPVRDGAAFRQRDRQVPRRVEVLVDGDHDVGPGEPPGGKLGAQARLGQHPGAGDQRRSAEHRARHRQQGGDAVSGHPDREMQHGF
ncbi:hypothetical protein QF026_003805 [Streptomyces aurantiacus]|nr:hypothetical protein [Streptomyces aurantiacus]